MGIFGSILKAGLPILGGVLGGPVGAAIGGGVAGMLGGNDKAKNQQQSGAQAANTAMGSFNYMQGSPIGQQYLPAGGAANAQQANLLGIGTDPAAAQAGYQNYLNSVGFQGQLRAGQQGITSSRAASGLLGSGSTAKALQAHGNQLGQQNFSNYLTQLGGVANQGLHAGGMMGQAAGQSYGQAANFQYGSGNAAAESKASGWDQLLGGLGAGFDAWQAGKGKTKTAAGAAGRTVPHDPYAGMA